MGIIAGYRVVRQLGAGSRSEVWLGRSVTGADEFAAHGPRTMPSAAALKVFGHEARPASIDREIEALSHVTSPHVVTLLDASAENAGEKQCLVLPRLDAGGLARLLSVRQFLEPGEFVTLAVPLARAVCSLHEVGVTHGDLAVRKVLFTTNGSPVVIGGARMSVSGEAPSLSALRKDEPYQRDRHALRSLVSHLLLRTTESASVTALGDWLDSTALDDPHFGENLIEKAFALAPPVALDLPWLPDRAIEPEPSARALPAPAGSVPGQTTGVSHRSRRKSTRRHLPWRDLAATVQARVAAAVGSIRPAYRALAVASVLVVAIGIVVAGAQSPAARSDSKEEPTDVPAPAAQAPDTSPADDPASAQTVGDVTLADDPVAAGRALLAQREHCIATASVPCLASSHQDGSAAWQSDVALVSALADGSVDYVQFWTDSRSVAVVDAMGGVVLLGVDRDPDMAAEAAETGPASVLVIRTEAGWRIRDVFFG